jgi:hypothetical protein
MSNIHADPVPSSGVNHRAMPQLQPADLVPIEVIRERTVTGRGQS